MVHIWLASVFAQSSVGSASKINLQFWQCHNKRIWKDNNQQTWCSRDYFTNTFVIHYFCEWSFFSLVQVITALSHSKSWFWIVKNRGVQLVCLDHTLSIWLEMEFISNMFLKTSVCTDNSHNRINTFLTKSIEIVKKNVFFMAFGICGTSKSLVFGFTSSISHLLPSS